MQNRVKPFLEERQISVYRFILDTGISPATGYKLAKNPKHLPSIGVLQSICDHYRVQPSEILFWTP